MDTVLLRDDFTGPTAQDLTAHVPTWSVDADPPVGAGWSKIASGGSLILTASGQARQYNGSLGPIYYPSGIGVYADMDVQGNSQHALSGVGLAARISMDGASRYYCRDTGSGSPVTGFDMTRSLAGTVTTLGSTTATLANPGTLLFSTRGEQLTLDYNGARLLTVFDSSIAAGKPGMVGVAAAATSDGHRTTMDNVVITERDPTAPLLVDSMTGAAGTALPAHVPETGTGWTRHPNSGVTDPVITAAGRLRANAVGITSLHYENAVLTSSRVRIDAEFQIVSTVSSFNGLCARLSTTTESFYYWRRDQQGGLWQMMKAVASVYTSLGTSGEALGANTNRAVRFDVADERKIGYFTGIARVVSTDNSIAGPGRVGVRFSDSGATDASGVHIDSLVVTQQAPLPTGPFHLDDFRYPSAGNLTNYLPLRGSAYSLTGVTSVASPQASSQERARAPSAGAQGAVQFVAPTDEYAVRAQIKEFSALGSAGFLLRNQSSGTRTFYECTYQAEATKRLTMVKNIASVVTTLGNYTLDIGTRPEGIDLEVECSNVLKEIRENGVARITSTDNDLTGGSPAITTWKATDTTGVHLDNLQATTVVGIDSRSAASTITGGGVVASQGYKGSSNFVGVSGGGSVDSLGHKRFSTSVSVAGGGSLASDGFKESATANSVTGGGELITDGFPTFRQWSYGEASTTGGGSLSSEGQKVGLGSSSVTGGGSILTLYRRPVLPAGRVVGSIPGRLESDSPGGSTNPMRPGRINFS